MIRRNGRPTPVYVSTRRSGAALIVAMLALLMIGIIGGSLLKGAVTRRRALEMDECRSQADWLADSGLRRARARAAASSDYRGEEWTIPASELGGSRTASVRITVDAPPDGSSGTAVIEVLYPRGEPRQLRLTRKHTIPRNTSPTGEERR